MCCGVMLLLLITYIYILFSFPLNEYKRQFSIYRFVFDYKIRSRNADGSRREGRFHGVKVADLVFLMAN